MRSLLPLASAVTAVLLLAGGCSGDDPAPSADPATSAPTPAPTATVAPAATPTPTPSESPEPTPSPTPEPTPTASPVPTPSATPAPAPAPSPAPPAGGPPRTYDEAQALVDRAPGAEELGRFASPSGNLYCLLESPVIPPACELGRGAVPDPAVCPADGPSQNVGRIELTDAGPRPVCNSDTIREPDAPTLGFGRAATWSGTDVTCLLKSFGVTCVEPSARQGFFLAKGRYQIFVG